MWSDFLKQQWAEECREAREGQRAASYLLNYALCSAVAIFTLVMLLVTRDGRWFAFPFAYAAFVLLYASWHAGGWRRETPLALAGFVLGLLAVNMSGVLG